MTRRRFGGRRTVRPRNHRRHRGVASAAVSWGMSITRGTSTPGTNDGSFRKAGQPIAVGTVTGRGHGTPFGDSATATTAGGETLSAVYESTGVGGSGFKITVNGEPASREQSDRVRAALSNAGYETPDGSHVHVKIPVGGNPADADSAICYAVLRGSGQIPESDGPPRQGRNSDHQRRARRRMRLAR